MEAQNTRETTEGKIKHEHKVIYSSNVKKNSGSFVWCAQQTSWEGGGRTTTMVKILQLFVFASIQKPIKRVRYFWQGGEERRK